MLGPPAIGSMKAKEAASVTTSRSCAWSKPLACAVLAMMEPKMASVDMLETNSVTKQMTAVTRSTKVNSPVPSSARRSAAQAASPERTVPSAIIAPPPKTKRISQPKPARTLGQSRTQRAPSSAPARHRSSPTSRRRPRGSRQPQGTRKSGSVSARPRAPLLRPGATSGRQPPKPPRGEAVNQSTTSSSRSSATTACSKLTAPRSARMRRKSSRSRGICSPERQTYCAQTPSHTTSSSAAESGRAQRMKRANGNSGSSGQKRANWSMKMPLVGVPTGVARPPMVAL
mmetsp:Transcript_46442/g.132397  ORF Transcript_46442/g.132397 Transcript_46442/m.132397 type:complete len:286 (+) Transcript_46442:297-1154(+)